MQRALAEAVLGTLHDRPQTHQREVLAAFSVQEWRDSYRWLDASGLSLYFLDQVKRLRWESALPAAVLARLEQNLADNRLRTASLIEECERINSGLLDAGVHFVNIKGITLVPHACPDLALRHQMDLDFLADENDVNQCRAVLEELGYVLSAAGPRVLEFKAGTGTMPSIKDLYKAKPQRTAEIHLEPSGALSRIERRVWRTLDGFRFPALCDCDAFLFQAGHLFKHLGDEWMRMSWVLELRRSVISQSAQESLWNDIREETEGDRRMRTAIGAGIVLATQAFGEFATKESLSWTVATMDRPMHLWLERYGRKVVLADFPGTKLYLLLPQPEKKAEKGAGSLRERLLPLHLPPRMVLRENGESFFGRVRRWCAQLGYTRFRLRFHVVEGARYLLEASRWRKIAGPVQ